METEENKLEQRVGEMHKRRETMPDGKRYIVYYTFGEEEKKSEENKAGGEVKENV